jgi:hypothetical protein
MNKIKQMLLNRNYILLTLILLGLRSLADASIGQAMVIMCFAGLVGYQKYLDTKKQKDISEELVRELHDLRNNVSVLMMKNTIKTSQQPQSQEIKRFF